MANPRDPYIDWMGDEDPEKLYLGYLNLLQKYFHQYRGLGSNFMDYWKGQYGDIYKDYQGAAAGRNIAGGDQQLGFNDYLTTKYLATPGQKFFQQWNKLAPWTRGERQVTPVRWNIPW